MIFLVVFGLSVLAVPLLGGRLQQIADAELRCLWALPLALLVQVFVTIIAPDVGEGALAVLHVSSYVLAGVFFFSNARVPGLWLLVLGAALNLVAIVANGGVMPARRGALASAGITPPATGRFANSQAVANPRLSFLGDVFAWPRPLPLANVFSVGDLLIVAGAALVIHRQSGSRLGRIHGRPTAQVASAAPLTHPAPEAG